MANSSGVIGVADVQRLLRDVGRAPAKVLTKATKAGAKILQGDAKANAPKDTGKLKRGIKLKAEKRRAGKRVYRIGFYGDFVKISKAGKRSFYPVSQEYGWVDRSGKYHQGKKFLRSALNNNRGQIKNTILETMVSEINRVR